MADDEEVTATPDYRAQLTEARSALRDVEQQRDELLATLAHELRNPLAPIGSALQVLVRSGSDTPAGAQALATMQRQFANLVRFIDDLLTISRMTRGKIELHVEAVDLGDVLARAAESVASSVRSAGHHLSIELRSPVTLRGDSIRLTQAFSSLLDNAVRYTAAGGNITLCVEAPRGNQVIIQVIDNGAGITPEQMAGLFQLYNHAEVPGTSGRAGLGIGLALARQLIELHGGTLTARSAGAGLGSVFEVCLPVQEPVAQGHATAEKPTETAEPLSGRRVLVVDDNRDAADSLALMLQLRGANIRVAYNGLDALDAIAEWAPDTALLDIGMPGLNGFDVARRVCESGLHQRTRLIALTGWGQPHDRDRSRAAGIDRHLVKPVDFEQLLEVLATTS